MEKTKLPFTDSHLLCTDAFYDRFVYFLVISWRFVLITEETGLPTENH